MPGVTKTEATPAGAGWINDHRNADAAILLITILCQAIYKDYLKVKRTRGKRTFNVIHAANILYVEPGKTEHDFMKSSDPRISGAYQRMRRFYELFMAKRKSLDVFKADLRKKLSRGRPPAMDPALQDALACQMLKGHVYGMPLTYAAGKHLYHHVMVMTKAWSEDHELPSRKMFKNVLERVDMKLKSKRELSIWRWTASGADVYAQSYFAYVLALCFHGIPKDDEEQLKLRIFNVDEITALRPSEKDARSNTRVIVPSRDERVANRWVNHNRVCTPGAPQHHGGARITLVVTISPCGALQPVIILKGEDELVYDKPPAVVASAWGSDCVVMTTKSGNMTVEVFKAYVELVLVPKAIEHRATYGLKEDDALLLTLDGASCHSSPRAWEAYELLADNHIYPLFLAANATHYQQACDATVFAKFKSDFRELLRACKRERFLKKMAAILKDIMEGRRTVLRAGSFKVSATWQTLCAMKVAFDNSTKACLCASAFKAVGLVPCSPERVSPAIHAVRGLDWDAAAALLDKHVHKLQAIPGRPSVDQARAAMAAVNADVDAAIASPPAADASCKSTQEEATDFFAELQGQIKTAEDVNRAGDGVAVASTLQAMHVTLRKFQLAYMKDAAKTARDLDLILKLRARERSKGKALAPGATRTQRLKKQMQDKMGMMREELVAENARKLLQRSLGERKSDTYRLLQEAIRTHSGLPPGAPLKALTCKNVRAFLELKGVKDIPEGTRGSKCLAALKMRAYEYVMQCEAASDQPMAPMPVEPVVDAPRERVRRRGRDATLLQSKRQRRDEC